MSHSFCRASRAGQAMVELAAALIAILVVVSGLLQLVLLATADTDTLAEATARAAQRATTGVLLAQTLPVIADWDPGPDGLRQTKDDRAIPGSLAGVRQVIAGSTAPSGDWSALEEARFRAIADLHHGLLPSTTFGLVRGEADREVETIPAARMLFGLRDPARVRNEVWMSGIGGLY